MKRIILPLLAALMTLGAVAQTFTDGELSYSILSNNTAMCTGYAYGSRTPSLLTIPSTAHNDYDNTWYRVTSISPYAFRGNTDLTHVVIHYGVSSLPDNCFSGCSNLTTIDLPGSLTWIGNDAFAGTKLKEVYCAADNPLPSLAPNAFTSVGWQRKWYHPVRFYQKPSQGDISQYFTIEYNTDAADYTDNGISYVFTAPPVGVDGTGNAMIVDLPDQSTVTGGDATVTYDRLNYRVTAIGFRAAYTHSNIETLDLSGLTGLISIGRGAFEACPLMKKATLGGSPAIDAQAFANCTTLSEVDLAGAVSIGIEAFKYCNRLTTVHIPATVTEIDHSPFMSCERMEQITVAAGNPNYTAYNGALMNKTLTNLICCPALCKMGTTSALTLPATVDTIGHSAFRSNSVITSLNIPYGVKWIGTHALSGMSALTTLRIPSSAEDIPSWDTFSDDVKLRTIYMGPATPPHVQGGDYGAFRGVADNLKQVTVYVPNHPQRDGYEAYKADTIWNACTIKPDPLTYDFASVTVASRGTYYYCVTYDGAFVAPDRNRYSGGMVALVKAEPTTTSTLTLNLPASVTLGGKTWRITEVWQDACRDMKTRTPVAAILPTVATIHENAFRGATVSALTAPSLLRVKDGAFTGCTSLEQVSMPLVRTIGDDAFRGSGLNAEVTLPASVTAIGDYAFAECAALPSLLLLGSDVTGYKPTLMAGNASSFKCYINVGGYMNFRRNVIDAIGSTNGTRVRPAAVATAEWTPVTCFSGSDLPATAEFYQINGYEAATHKVVTAQVTGGLSRDYGLLMHATAGTVHRFEAGGGKTLPNNWLVPVNGYNPVTLDADHATTAWYIWQPETTTFERVTETQTMAPGGAVLAMNKNRVGTATTLWPDFALPEFKTGDVDGNGVVDVEDMNIVINMILGKASAADYPGQCDTDGNGVVDVEDMNRVINIILGKD